MIQDTGNISFEQGEWIKGNDAIRQRSRPSTTMRIEGYASAKKSKSYPPKSRIRRARSSSAILSERHGDPTRATFHDPSRSSRQRGNVHGI